MSIILFFAILFVLILVHELGHFIVAKRTGMRVDEFGIGFPPKLFGIKKGETEYTLNAFPIGGFVRIYGEDAVNATKEDGGRAFVNRSRWSQVAVLIAGVSMNIIFAWFLFSLVFVMGTQSVVSESDATSAAELKILSVFEGSPADIAGLKSGDVILSLTPADDSSPVVQDLTPSGVSSLIRSNGTVRLSVMRGEEVDSMVLEAKTGLAEDDPSRPIIGITTGLVEAVRLPIHIAVYEATILTFDSLVRIVVGISSLLASAVVLNADLSQVAGPVGIVGLVGDAASFGISALLMFTAFISLNLAVINLLPFPALDGGRLLFVIIEVLKGSPIKPKIAYALNAAGFALLILLMLAVTYNDILRIIG